VNIISRMSDRAKRHCLCSSRIPQRIVRLPETGLPIYCKAGQIVNPLMSRVIHTTRAGDLAIPGPIRRSCGYPLGAGVSGWRITRDTTPIPIQAAMADGAYHSLSNRREWDRVHIHSVVDQALQDYRIALCVGPYSRLSSATKKATSVSHFWGSGSSAGSVM
jgi:hypothetical protein